MTISRLRIVWTGFQGAPGYTTLYFGVASPPPLAAVRTWLDGLKSGLANVCSLQIANSGDELDEATGLITGAWSGTAQAAVVGTGGASYAAPTGFLVNHATLGIVNGRHVRGRTFFVPSATGNYDANGNINNTLLATLNTANAAFNAAVSSLFVVWHRPVAGAGGSIHSVLASTTPDKAIVLRSRRD